MESFLPAGDFMEENCTIVMREGPVDMYLYVYVINSFKSIPYKKSYS